MKIAILNGSPKGMNSVTMQYVLFLQKKFPEHQFEIHNVCHDIKELEDNEAAFNAVVDDVAASDVVIWAFPLYFLVVHSHYKRFIELLFERHAEARFKGKYAAILTTSIRFFDHTGHEYIHGICDDLAMRCVGGYSAEMYDLTQQPERDRLVLFAKSLFQTVEERAVTARRFAPVEFWNLAYRPADPPEAIDTEGKSVIIVTDAENEEGNLSRMVERLQASLRGPVSVINLHAIRIRGGCMGCIQCALDNQCVYRDADDIHEVYARLSAADILVFAGSIRDRYLSSRWKLFMDRGFFNGHVPVFAGKQVGYLIAGPLMQLASLRQLLEATVLCEQANLVGIVTDECRDSVDLDRQITHFARRLVQASVAGYVQPPNFLAVGGRKLLRDAIWSSMRVVFEADHKYFKSHSLYDFPTRSWKTKVSDAFFSLLLRIPRIRKRFRARIKDEMLKPLVKVLEET